MRYKSSFIDFERLVGIDSEAMRQHLSSLEEGAVFRDYGITNLLEGDFFSWYTSKDQWTDAIAKKFSDVFGMLNIYSDKAVLNTGSGSSDFFKELYQGMIPSAVRHSLGEYYTKQWLASQVVEEALEQVNISNWRGLGLVAPRDLNNKIVEKLKEFSVELVELERHHWNGIWARIVTNYLATANLGKFDIIVGNPPWDDWKNLSSGYRDRIKSLCISRKLFSGDRVTGGINLNICALISNVAAENWLAENGVLGFLMPEPLIFQSSYEGFRKFYLTDDSRLYFQKFTNWNRAGHPFKPVTQKFLTFYLSKRERDYRKGIDVAEYILNKGESIDDCEELVLDEHFTIKNSIVATCHDSKNMFSYVESRQQLKDFMSIAGQSYYKGREGIEFYPQEMTIFVESGLPSTKTCTSLTNIQVKKSKYHVPKTVELLETEFLHPLIKGIDISPFHVDISGYIVPFPYDERDMRLPIAFMELSRRAPKLASFYQKYKELILAQTQYNERIIGKKGEFYSLARVGTYSFADCYVVFRDNTKWGAAVVETIDTKWGGKKRPQFQNHAVSICEDGEGNYINPDEAHFICGIMNTPVAFEYVQKSSDSRSYPIRPRIYIPKYDKSNKIHERISKLSREAHNVFNNIQEVHRIMKELNDLYLSIVKNRK